MKRRLGNNGRAFPGERSAAGQSGSSDWPAVFVQEGRTEPVIDAEALYWMEKAGGAAGYWFDTRGTVQTLRGVAESDRLVTEWRRPEVESGRTTYRVVDGDTIEVIDEVCGDDGYREFARVTYHGRREG